ncbi:hypothetical protein A2U01_0085151 [Trifolium medium]|uniref:Uncharacterized protein n=1 Tax=Trifolium medium TaxID=97028 RepID=A0A392TT64_9FABA|nr:hypothetical protein [Trifolium medium]
MDPSYFHTQIAWPGDMPQLGEGAGTSGAGGDDDDVDNAAADAFEDDDEMQDDCR